MNILGKISVAICAFIAISCSLSAQAPDFTKAAENTSVMLHLEVMALGQILSVILFLNIFSDNVDNRRKNKNKNNNKLGWVQV